MNDGLPAARHQSREIHATAVVSIGNGLVGWQRAVAGQLTLERERDHRHWRERAELAADAQHRIGTGELREQYEADLSQGGIIDTYEQVSATTSYEVLEVGLQQVNEAQDTATLVVFGQYVVESVNSGTQAAPAGSECTVTDDGAQSCTQTVRVTVTDVDGEWKISELTLLTTS